MDDYLAKPVRLEDVRAIVERWGPVAGTAKSEASAAAKTPVSAAAKEPASPAGSPPVGSSAPVDMARLLDFTDGSPENLRDLVQANLTPQNWAILLQSWVWRLGMLCDVRFTHVVGDIRERVAREKDKYREGEAVDQLLADTFKSGKAYRMVRIAKDVAEGKSLEKTLRSFIKS